ncbi:globin domain-containing protein [Bradyrhizobium lablabi]|uniref:globin domain-containing protein n=1 Tax=Bradyrhizobium lablabi TaxID=722472 RepID=UPI003D9B4BAB
MNAADKRAARLAASKSWTGFRRSPDAPPASGRRHRDYNIDRADHEKVRHALLLTLAEFLGDDFTPEVFRAWETIYGKMAETMIEAARERSAISK